MFETNTKPNQNHRSKTIIRTIHKSFKLAEGSEITLVVSSPKSFIGKKLRQAYIHRHLQQRLSTRNCDMESNTLDIYLRKRTHVTGHKIVGNVFRFGGGHRNVPAMTKRTQDRKYMNYTRSLYACTSMHTVMHRRQVLNGLNLRKTIAPKSKPRMARWPQRVRSR